MTNPSFDPTDGPNVSRAKVREDYERVRDDAGNLADSAKKYARGRIDEEIGDAQETIQRGIGDIEKSIRKNPTQAALIAAGIGFVFGLLITR